MPWAKAGYAQMEEQLLVKKAGDKTSLTSLTTSMAKPKVLGNTDFITVSGKGFCVKLITIQGQYIAWSMAERKLFVMEKVLNWILGARL